MTRMSPGEPKLLITKLGTGNESFPGPVTRYDLKRSYIKVTQAWLETITRFCYNIFEGAIWYKLLSRLIFFQQKSTDGKLLLNVQKREKLYEQKMADKAETKRSYGWTQTNERVRPNQKLSEHTWTRSFKVALT